MHSTSIYHLVILFEEKVERLTDSIKYTADCLPYPFIVKDPSRQKTSVSQAFVCSCTGRRPFSSLTIEYYVPENWKMTSTGLNCKDEAVDFHSGNPMVETTEGIIHLYKNQTEVHTFADGMTSNMLCIFSVPSYITVKDLLVFVAPMREAIEELKVVKNDTPNRYMALLKFRSRQETDQFYITYNNICYRNLESEVCQLMYVSHVEKTHPSKGLAFPTKDLLELPSCPVCLERLDEPVQGILTTILCNHTFHDQCIARVEDATCPVCRYVQSPELLDDSQCAECGTHDNLWICLICGRIGCGRYGQKHAHRHFEQTGHTFALELGKNLVWDYVDDAYVHRLAVNHEDGKLVQLGPGSETGDKKMDMISMEFSAVLTSQLESQRAYFEEQLEQLSVESTNRIQLMEARMEEISEKLRSAEERLTEALKEKSSCSRKLQQATGLAQRLQKELEEERALNKSLLTNETTWRTRTEQAETEAKTAREECRELLLNLELRSKLEELASTDQLSNAEIENSAISIQNQQPNSSRRRKKRQNR
ncbi:BRCA1-associated protein [Fasciolopsis buskii]|uniref:BRCA1-associated protein n=1 Tax=Fasciolopsis buskii TaxID=27845 RepID=A0A8E0VJN0_9TREM|nr:BRCA1-associated protein [Fasciolopsis buski]